MKCPLCDAASKKNQHRWLIEHAISEHKSLFLSNNRGHAWARTCIVCHQNFTAISNLSYHLQQQHSLEELLAAIHASLLNINPE